MTDDTDLPHRFPDRHAWVVGAWPVRAGAGGEVQRVLTKGAGPDGETVIAIHEADIVAGKRQDGLRPIIQLGSVHELLRDAKAICDGDARTKTLPGLIERLALLVVIASVTGELDKVVAFMRRIDDIDPPSQT